MFERLFRHVAVRRLEPQPPFSDSELRAVRVLILVLLPLGLEYLAKITSGEEALTALAIAG